MSLDDGYCIDYLPNVNGAGEPSVIITTPDGTVTPSELNRAVGFMRGTEPRLAGEPDGYKNLYSFYTGTRWS